MSAEFILALGAQYALRELPVFWPDAWQSVFVDITGRGLHRLNPSSKRHEDVQCSRFARLGV